MRNNGRGGGNGEREKKGGKRKGKKNWRGDSGYEHLEDKNEDLSSNPLYSCKKPGMVIGKSPTQPQHHER